MERIYPRAIGEVLRDLFAENCMQQQLDERRAVELWPTVIGKALASECRRPEVKNGLMTIGVASPALRHELNMQRTPLRRAINRAVGTETIKELRFIL